MAATVRAALYLRVSTGRQADSDLSIPDQRRQANGYCASRGWQIVADYVEPGASATGGLRSYGELGASATGGCWELSGAAPSSRTGAPRACRNRACGAALSSVRGHRDVELIATPGDSEAQATRVRVGIALGDRGKRGGPLGGRE